MGAILKTKKLTTFSEGIIVGLILLTVTSLVYFGLPLLSDKEHGEPINKVSDLFSLTTEKPDLVLAYNTFPGMQGILYMNGGMEPNEQSELYKKYGLKLKIKQIDIVNDTRDALKTGDLDVVYCTTDALSTETGSGSVLLELGVKEFLKVNESRGADALVAVSSINKVSDLKGKKVAYARGTASHTLLINLLETNSLSVNDIVSYQVADGIEAANVFKNNQCDAALVWAPDDEDCVNAIKGAKILVTTQTATQIIADGLLATDKTLKNKKEELVSLSKAWLEGNAIISTNSLEMSKSNELFAKHFKLPLEVTEISSQKIRFSTLGDNKQFFGLDATYSGVTGEKMYSRMALKYSELGLTKSPAPWRNVSTTEIVEELLKDNKFASKPEQAAEVRVAFTPPTKQEIVKEATGSKIVSITFENNSFVLDEEDKNIIDREVTALAQAFGNARVRVEGNTDNVGNVDYNVNLSKKRAESVVNYLVTEHRLDKNKFIVLGNGPSKPVSGCETNSTEDCKSKNRRTEFQFIW